MNDTNKLLEVFGWILEDICNRIVHLRSLRSVQKSVIEGHVDIHHLGNLHFSVHCDRTVHWSAHHNCRHCPCEVGDRSEGVVVTFHCCHVCQQNCSEVVLLNLQEWQWDFEVVGNKTDYLSQDLYKQTWEQSTVRVELTVPVLSAF